MKAHQASTVLPEHWNSYTTKRLCKRTSDRCWSFKSVGKPSLASTVTELRGHTVSGRLEDPLVVINAANIVAILILVPLDVGKVEGPRLRYNQCIF